MAEFLADIRGLRHRAGKVEQPVLPTGVGVGPAQDADGIGQVLRALDDAAVPLRGLETAEVPRVPVGVEYQLRVADPHGVAVVDTGHIVVAETIHVELAEPVPVYFAEVLGGELLAEIRAGPIGEEFSGKVSHHRVRLARGIIDKVEGEIGMGMRVHGIDDDGDPPPVAGVDSPLHSRRAAEPVVGAEVAQRRIAPFHILADIGDRHELKDINPESLKIVELADDAVKITVEFAHVELVDHQAVHGRDRELIVAPGKCRAGIGAEGRQRAQPGLPPKGVRDPQENLRTAVELVAVEVPAGFAVVRAGHRIDTGSHRHGGLPKVVLGSVLPGHPELRRRNVPDKLVRLVDDSNLESIVLVVRDAGQVDAQCRLPAVRVRPDAGADFRNVYHWIPPRGRLGAY